MHDLPPFGWELAEAQERLDEVLARCAIRLKVFDGARGANDNLLFPGVSVPAEADGSCSQSPRDTAG
jgi:hypothetical protein